MNRNGHNLEEDERFHGRRRCILVGVTMPMSNTMLPLFLTLGALFGALAAAGAYVISYAEYRRRMLRPDQDPRTMALEVAAVTFLVFFVAAIVLSFVLPLVLGGSGA